MEDQNEVVIVTNVYGDICIRKARRKRQKLLVKEMLYDYANNTTLHGLPYVTRTGLTLVEKIFWFITFVISVCLCLFLISKSWTKWRTSPVIVTVSEQLVPVYEVPFPSVTICPQSKCKASVYNFTREQVVINSFMMKNKNAINDTMKERIAMFASVSNICKIPVYLNLVEIYPNKTTDSSAVKHILKVAPNYEDVFMVCLVGGVVLPCKKLFDKVLTSEGLCYSMNSLAAKEIFRMDTLQKDYAYLYTTRSIKGWSEQQGYNESIDNPEVYPAPGHENGKNPDIQVVLKEKINERDHICNGLSSGFKIYIRHPIDLPQSSLYYYAALHNQVSSMALSFNVLNTSESLRRYDAEVRQCYFPDERYLRYFSLYSASNCMIECLSNITDKICGCVEFHMPYASSKKICTNTPEHENCTKFARQTMRTQERIKDSTSRCHCLPACNSIDYEAEILKTDFNLKQLMESHFKATNQDVNWYKKFNFSKLEMYFKKPRFLSMRRSELYGVIDFLAACGGLLGLFLGFSFLSLVEIFYFLSLRLCCTLKKDLEEEKAQNETEKGIHIEKF